MDQWKIRPAHLRGWPDATEYIMFVDESGSPELKGVRKALRQGISLSVEERLFTVVGVILNRRDFSQVKEQIVQLKRRYWPPDGSFDYPKYGRRCVCLRSYDIRNRKGPFDASVLPNYDEFIDELTEVIARVPCIIRACCIDKQGLVERYPFPRHPYELSMDFLFERFAVFTLKRHQARGCVVLEARGKREDKALLKHLVALLETGTFYVSATEMQHINGVYFNPKWDTEHAECASYVGLEIADLCLHPIVAYCRSGVKNRAFAVVEPKLSGYPRYFGKGLKRFPWPTTEETASWR